jgi:hypothetical protein
MAEFESGGQHYRSEKMSAREQLHLLRGLGPLFAPMARAAMMEVSGNEATRRVDLMIPFFEAFSKMEERDVNTLVNKCFAVVRRRVGGGNGTSQYGPPMFTGQRDQYEDLSLGDLMTICWEVVQENLGGFFAIGSGPEAGSTPLSPPFTTAPSAS